VYRKFHGPRRNFVPVDESRHDARQMRNNRPEHEVKMRSWKPNHRQLEALDVKEKTYHDEEIDTIRTMLQGKNGNKKDKSIKREEKNRLLKQLLDALHAETTAKATGKHPKASEKLTAELRERFRAVSSAGNYDAWTTSKKDRNKGHHDPKAGSGGDFSCQDGEAVTLEVALAQNLRKFNIASSKLFEAWETELNVNGAQTAKIVPVSLRKIVVQTICNNLGHVTSFFSSRASVYSIQIRPQMHLLNKHATTVMQGAGAGLQSVLWDKGLTGEGQIVGIADTGIDSGPTRLRCSHSQ